MKIACFTVAAMDQFSQAGTAHAGGNALNQAVRFRHLGHETLFAGALGTDKAGDVIAALLSAEGVDLSCLHRVEGQTASNRLVNDAAGERHGVAGAWENGVYTDFRLSQADWDHMAACDVWCTHADCPDFAEALRRKRVDQRLAVDFLHLLDPERLAACAGVADICYIGGTPDMAGPLAELSKDRPGVMVLTLGAQGSLAFSGGRQYHQPAVETAGVVDTTGCGDAFQAAFTASWLTNGDLEAALRAGAENGWIAALTRGGVPWHTRPAAMAYGTHNAAKVDNIRRRIQGVPLTITALPELAQDIPEAEETGRDPLQNAEQKARHYWRQLRRPVFSIDSGLYFQHVGPEDQPGVHIRRMNGHRMDDAEMIAHYAALARKYGGRLEAYYHNAICLALDETRVVRYDGEELNSAPFLLVDVPHAARHPGFPLDSLSVEPVTGAYFIDLPHHPDKPASQQETGVTTPSRDGFAAFFRRVLPLLRSYGACPLKERGAR
jgi:sugar/nucleoside kinase (ribokinase family)